MTVYADMLFAVNFTALFLLLYIYSFLSRASLKIYRILLAAALCGVYSVAETVYSLPYCLRTAVLFCFSGMVFGVRAIVRNTFFLAVCAMGVEILVLGFITMMGETALIQSGSAVIFISGAGGVRLLLLSYAAFLLLGRVWQNMKKQRRISLEYNGKKVCFYALYDSGNLLRYDGRAVIIAVWDSVCPLLKYNSYNQLCEGTENFATYKSVSGDGVIPLFKPEKCFVNSAEKDVYIGVIEKNLFGNYTAIVGDV